MLPVVSAFVAFANANTGWQGSPTALLKLLPDYASPKATQSAEWPTKAQGLRVKLDDAGDYLHKHGVGYEKLGRSNSGANWRIRCYRFECEAA